MSEEVGRPATSVAARRRGDRRPKEILCAYILFVATGLHLCYWLLRPTGESPPHRADSTLAIATVVLAAVASVLLLIAARAASAIAGCALGLLLSANLGHLLSSFDEPDAHLRQLVRYGGWLSIPITLLALTSLLLLAVPAKAARPTGADQ